MHAHDSAFSFFSHLASQTLAPAFLPARLFLPSRLDASAG